MAWHVRRTTARSVYKGFPGSPLRRSRPARTTRWCGHGNRLHQDLVVTPVKWRALTGVIRQHRPPWRDATCVNAAASARPGSRLSGNCRQAGDQSVPYRALGPGPRCRRPISSTPTQPKFPLSRRVNPSAPRPALAAPDPDVVVVSSGRQARSFLPALPPPYPPTPGAQVSMTVREIARFAHAPVSEEVRDAHCHYHDRQPDRKRAPRQAAAHHLPPLVYGRRSGRICFPAQREINLSATNHTDQLLSLGRVDLQMRPDN